MILCVECGAATKVQKHERVTADVCPEGHGPWLAERELLSAVRTQPDDSSIGNRYDEGRSLSVAADHDVVLDDEVRNCPMCKAAMGSVTYAFTTGVTVDVCEKHGVWLDGGELEQLEAWAAKLADPSSAEFRARQASLDRIVSGECDEIAMRLNFVDVVKAFLPRRFG